MIRGGGGHRRWGCICGALRKKTAMTIYRPPVVAEGFAGRST
jgi:hypothetical protein